VVRQMSNIARRAPGSVDMRAALAAMYWSKGRQQEAESQWQFACDQITVSVGFMRDARPSQNRHGLVCADFMLPNSPNAPYTTRSLGPHRQRYVASNSHIFTVTAHTYIWQSG
jgi:hypothetical protein